MCDVPSIAVFCSESIECFPGTTSKFFLKLLVTIPVAPIITGIIVHFRFHIRCISIHIIIIIIIIIIGKCKMIEICTNALLLYFKRQVISHRPSTTKHPDSNHFPCVEGRLPYMTRQLRTGCVWESKRPWSKTHTRLNLIKFTV